MNEKRKNRCDTCDCYECDCDECTCSCHEKEEDIELKPFVLGTKTGEIVSDSFSFLDTSADDLLANGNGGLKQLHNYTTLDEIHKIVTPPENYTPNTIGNDENNMDNLIKQRENEIKM